MSKSASTHQPRRKMTAGQRLIAAAKEMVAVSRGQRKPARITILEVSRSSEPGVPVMVRLQPDLLAKLDDLRGGMTRPEAIRRLLRGVA